MTYLIHEIHIPISYSNLYRILGKTINDEIYEQDLNNLVAAAEESASSQNRVDDAAYSMNEMITEAINNEVMELDNVGEETQLAEEAAVPAVTTELSSELNAFFGEEQVSEIYYIDVNSENMIMCNNNTLSSPIYINITDGGTK